MGEGWETARRRGPGNDWVSLRLAGEGRIRLAELDTSWFLHNAPGSARLTGRTAAGEEVEVLPGTRLLPDTRHRFAVDGPAVTDVRLDAHPDGGMARLRLWGSLTAAGRAALGRRWFDTLPDAQAAAVLTGWDSRRPAPIPCPHPWPPCSQPARLTRPARPTGPPD